MADEPLEASGQPEPAARPDWLESNFDTVEAQAQAYQQARMEMHRAHQEREQALQYAQQAAEALEAAAQEPDPEPGFHGFNPLVAQYQAAMESDDPQDQMAMQAFIASQIVDQKLNEFTSRQQQRQPDPGQDEYFAIMAENLARDKYEAAYGQPWEDIRADAAVFLATKPELVPEGITPMQAANQLVFAAEHVRGQRALTGQEQPGNQQPADMYRQRRIMAQGLQGAGTPPPSQDTDAERWERIKQAPVSSYNELRNQQQ